MAMPVDNMRILIHSYAYAPSIGGIERTSRLLAEEFVRLGHEVRILTATGASSELPDKAIPETEYCPEGSFLVYRKPSILVQRKCARWAQVVWQNNISLRFWVSTWGLSKPVFMTAQTWPGHLPGRRGCLPLIKRRIYRANHAIAISQAVAADLGGFSTFIPNPVSTVFSPRTEIAVDSEHTNLRDQRLLFVGRLVSDKGVDILIDAFSNIAPQFPECRLTIVGEGPQRISLENQAAQTGLAGRITFQGSQNPQALRQFYQNHGILVIPSRWPEPFGIVALEGLAANCVVIGSDKGGLPEAIGPAGLTFPNENTIALAKILQQTLGNHLFREKLRAAARQHLLQFSLESIAQHYLQLFQANR